MKSQSFIDRGARAPAHKLPKQSAQPFNYYFFLTFALVAWSLVAFWIDAGSTIYALVTIPNAAESGQITGPIWRFGGLPLLVLWDIVFTVTIIGLPVLASKYPKLMSVLLACFIVGYTFQNFIAGVNNLKLIGAQH